MDMTPEQWNQLVTILLAGLSGLFVFSGLIGRVIYTFLLSRIQAQAKTKDAELEKLKNDYKLKFTELESEAKTRDELFKLNQAHANSYNIVAHALDRLESSTSAKLSENTVQIEVFGGQLQTVGSNVTDLSSTVTLLVEKVDAALTKIDTFVSDLLERDDANTSANTARGREIIATMKALQAEMAILKEVKADLAAVKDTVSRLDDTLPLIDNVDTPPDDVATQKQIPANNSESDEPDKRKSA